MIKVFVKDIIQAYEFDIEMLKADKKNTNRTKLIQRDALMLQFLHTVPENLRISCERTPTDELKLNAGSLTECIINYHLANADIKEVSKSGGLFDAKRGCIDVEIKLSVNGSCYNTPIKTPSLIYLANRDGVFMVRKADIETLAPKGKLPYNKWEGAKMVKFLTKALGYEIDESESENEE